MKLGKPLSTIYYEDPKTLARFVFGSITCIACERCANVLLYQNGTTDGYALHSDAWFKCPTNCELCVDEPRYIPKPENKLTLVKNSPDAA